MHFHKRNMLINRNLCSILKVRNLQFLSVHQNQLINFMVLDLYRLYLVDEDIVIHIIFKENKT